MLIQENNETVISIPGSLKLVGIIGGVWAILVVLSSTIAYLSAHSDFSFFTTYLSDIGDTPVWPQVLFNSGTLLAAPLRILILVLLVLRLMQLGAGRPFAVSVITIGVVSVIGTILMTAVPFSKAPSMHKLGIPLYFFGVVIFQMIIFFKEWALKNVPKILPILSLLLVIVYFIFAVLVALLEKGIVNRNAPVMWEWLAFFTSVIWVFAQSTMLGKPTISR